MIPFLAYRIQENAFGGLKHRRAPNSAASPAGSEIRHLRAHKCVSHESSPGPKLFASGAEKRTKWS